MKLAIRKIILCENTKEIQELYKANKNKYLINIFQQVIDRISPGLDFFNFGANDKLKCPICKKLNLGICVRNIILIKDNKDEQIRKGFTGIIICDCEKYIEKKDWGVKAYILYVLDKKNKPIIFKISSIQFNLEDELGKKGLPYKFKLPENQDPT